MHIHILGICGTFMGGLAVLAKQLGYRVTGSDANVYPPMSTQLEQQGIELTEGYDPSQLDPAPDLVVIGNAMSRGNPCVEYVLDRNLPYISGPQWLLEHVLQDRWVLAVAGTHGKTTTASMLAWVLEYAKLEPGFLIGGVPGNFPVSARLGSAPFFVIEADEYDCAFFDKRSKFVHYHPRTLVMNNLEFDHADIFPDLAAIQRQFHHLMRTVPSNGRVLFPQADDNLTAVRKMGCWSEVELVGQDDAKWKAVKLADDGSAFEVWLDGEKQGEVHWECIGEHNVNNGLMAIAAARHAGVMVEHGIAALCQFKSPKRRMELKGEVAGISVYDDFAHHPTAIETTLGGLRAKVGELTYSGGAGATLQHHEAGGSQGGAGWLLRWRRRGVLLPAAQHRLGSRRGDGPYDPTGQGIQRSGDPDQPAGGREPRWRPYSDHEQRRLRWHS